MKNAPAEPYFSRTSADLLDTLTAADSMTANPISLRQDANIANATMLFTDRALTDASVIDEQGRPIRVSRSTDVLIHDPEHLNLGVAYSDQCAGEAFSDRMELE